jgi:hypothetical protein
LGIALVPAETRNLFGEKIGFTGLNRQTRKKRTAGVTEIILALLRM